MARKRTWLLGIVTSLVILAAPLGARAGDDCAPGEDGCMPTAQQCASGSSNGLWLGRNVGSAAVCIGGEGHNVTYVAGSGIRLCGSIVVGDQSLVTDDPNRCDEGPDAAKNLRFRVQLPSEYSTSQDRYPVVYLLSGLIDEHRWFEIDTSLPSLADEGVIIVSVFNGGGWWADWRNGELDLERINTEILPALIDANLRTIADRAHRAIAGVSNSGYGSMLYASRRPDKYVAVGAFMGVVDIRDPAWMAFSTVASPQGTYQDPSGGLWAGWGNPATEEVWWRGRNPLDLATNLRGVSIWHSAGDGIPTINEVGQDPSVLAFSTWNEMIVRQMNDRFDAALTGGGIDHTYLRRPGIHTDANTVADLHRWWPVLKAAFGSKTPSSFDYRTIDSETSVWGWHFQADPSRATEFFEARDVSASRLTLIGSGTTTVTTPPLFGSNEVVRLCGATTMAERAGGDGRLTFQVDLGPAHYLEQYTVAQRIAESVSEGSYFVTRTVRLLPALAGCDNEQVDTALSHGEDKRMGRRARR